MQLLSWPTTLSYILEKVAWPVPSLRCRLCSPWEALWVRGHCNFVAFSVPVKARFLLLPFTVKYLPMDWLFILMCYELLRKLEKGGADLQGVRSKVGSWTLSSSECCVQVLPSFLAPFLSILVEFQMFCSPTYFWVLFTILLKWGGVSSFVGRSYCGGCSQLVLGSMSFFLSRCSVLPNKGKTCLPMLW